MRTMDWRDLQIFLTVAEKGQLTKAAAALGMNAKTIARRLRHVETAMGSTLFEQTREGQVLTEAGAALLAHAEIMAQAAWDIEAQNGLGTAGLSGTLRISVAEGFGSWFLAKHLSNFASAYPDLTIDLVASSGFLSPSKREADIAVLLSRPKSGPMLTKKLSDYALRLYATPAYLAAFGHPDQPADLAIGHRLIGYVPDLIYSPELQYLDEIHPGLAPKMRSSSINAQHRLIGSGAGIGVLPCFIGDADPGLVPVLPSKRIVRGFWLVTHKDSQRLARVQAGKDWLADMVTRHHDVLLPE